MKLGGGILFLFLALATAGSVFGQSQSENPARFPDSRSSVKPFDFDQSQFRTPRSSYFNQSQMVAPRSSFNGFNVGRQHKRRMQDYSRIYIEKTLPREIKVHDIVTIVVNEKAEINLNSRFNRQRQASLKAELKEFLRLSEDGNLTNAAENQPKIDATLNGRLSGNGHPPSP